MTRSTIYDINPEPEKKWFKIDSMIVCAKCKKSVNGYIILDRKTLQVVDTSGFLIFDDVVCNNCNADFRDDFDSVTLDVCKELGITPKQIGLDMKWGKNKK